MSSPATRPRAGRAAERDPEPVRPPQGRLRGRLDQVWPPFLLLAAAVGVWALVTALASINSTILPGPALVARATWADRANLAPAMWTTTKEALLGIAVATLLAGVLALAVDWSRSLRRSLYPLMVTSQTLPIIVLAPLVVIWFGFGMAPKVGLVALFTFFPIVVGMVRGLGSADPDAMDLLRTMGASRLQLLMRVRAPSAIPQSFTGLKVAVTYAYVSAIFAEYVGAEQGLGVYMQASERAVRTELVFGAVIVTALLTLALFGIVGILERLATPWRRPGEAEGSW